MVTVTNPHKGDLQVYNLELSNLRGAYAILKVVGWFNLGQLNPGQPDPQTIRLTENSTNGQLNQCTIQLQRRIAYNSELIEDFCA